MYCLSLHTLALDRQVMEAVWPNNMALGQIWTQKRKRGTGAYNRIMSNKWQVTANTTITLRDTSSSGVISQRQICPSWQPVIMVLKSSITNTVLMQWVGAVRPHSTIGKTKLFPDMMLMCPGGGEGHNGKREDKRDKKQTRGGGWSKWNEDKLIWRHDKRISSFSSSRVGLCLS